MITDWIVAISAAITAGSVLFIAWQAFTSAKQLEVMEKQLASDHERSRRQRAIDVIETWTKTLDKSLPSARNVIEGCSIEECRKLRNKEPLSVSATKLHFLESALQEILDDDDELYATEDGVVKLTGKHSAHLFFLAIQHLNALEIALQSWLNGIADKEILERELKYLIKPADGVYVLENFRTVMGGVDAYPAISSFVDHIKSSAAPAIVQPSGNIA